MNPTEERWQTLQNYNTHQEKNGKPLSTGGSSRQTGKSPLAWAFCNKVPSAFFFAVVKFFLSALNGILRGTWPFFGEERECPFFARQLLCTVEGPHGRGDLHSCTELFLLSRMSEPSKWCNLRITDYTLSFRLIVVQNYQFNTITSQFSILSQQY